MATITPVDTPNRTVTTGRGDRFDVVVIGAGQAGLATGYHLAQRGLRFLILDAHERIGDSWRTRWDSLRLFTPARFAGLPGMRFPASPQSFPTKDDLADYLENYAATMSLPVRPGRRATRVARTDSGSYIVTANHDQIEADHVIIAVGGYQLPKVPDFAADLDPTIVQLHSHEYRNPSQFKPGGVLVVGASNSGAEIAIEAAQEHATTLAGRDPGQIPFRIEKPVARVAIPMLWFAWNRVLTVTTPMGRKMMPNVRAHGGPLVRIKRADLDAAGVERVHLKAVGVKAGQPMLEDGRVLGVANIVWCTGYRQDYSWIDGLTYGEDGYPEQDHGVVTDLPGLYFVGLKFQRSFGSMLVGGVGRDAADVVAHIAARSRYAV